MDWCGFVVCGVTIGLEMGCKGVCHCFEFVDLCDFWCLIVNLVGMN